MTKDEALKMALGSMSGRYCNLHKEAIAAIKEVLAQPEHSCVACEGNPKVNNNPCAVCGLAQPEQEPVAWGFQNTAITGSNRWMMLREEIPANDQYGGALWTPLYITPPHRKPLTDEEIWKVVDQCKGGRIDFARAIEAAHGIKE